MGRIIAWHRPEQPVLGAMGIDPVPDIGHLGAVGGRHVDRLTMTIAAGPPAAAVQRIAAARLDAGRDVLPIVVAEGAQDCPRHAVRIHGLARVIKLLAEIGVHAADHVFRQRHADTLGRGGVLPGEVAGAVLLFRQALIDVPEILRDLVLKRDRDVLAGQLGLTDVDLGRVGAGQHEARRLRTRSLLHGRAREADGSHRLGQASGDEFLDRGDLARFGIAPAIGKVQARF
jgi:hypothetical protein